MSQIKVNTTITKLGYLSFGRNLCPYAYSASEGGNLISATITDLNIELALSAATCVQSSKQTTSPYNFHRKHWCAS